MESDHAAVFWYFFMSSMPHKGRVIDTCWVNALPNDEPQCIIQSPSIAPNTATGIMEVTTTQAIKMSIIMATSLSRDALHIYFGLAVLLLSMALLRKPLNSFIPWVVVFGMSILGELVDMRDDFVFYGYWRWDAGLHDVLNTLFWPTVLVLLARYSHFFHTTHHATRPRFRRRLQRLFRLFDRSG
jgi:hypothetical protein